MLNRPRRIPAGILNISRALLAAGASAAALRGLDSLTDRRLVASRDTIGDDSRVFVSGGSRGLGFILARKLLERGARVAFCARDTRGIERAIDALVAACGPRSRERVIGIPCDISKEGHLERALNEARDHWGGLDLIINNAGIIQVGPIDSMAEKEFAEAINTNLWPLICSTLWASSFDGFGPRGGTIVNITSIGGAVPVPHLAPYSCAKFGALGFSLASGIELSRKDIRVVTVVPGLMRTGSFLNAMFKGRRESELRWFALGSTAPLLSINAERAADKILRAIALRRSFVVLGLPAKTLRLIHALLPRVTIAALRGVNRTILPAPSPSEGPEKYAKPGNLYRRGISRSILTRLGDLAADRYNQRAG